MVRIEERATQSKAYVATLHGGSALFPGQIEALGYVAGTAPQTLTLRQTLEGETAQDTGNAALLDPAHRYALPAP